MYDTLAGGMRYACGIMRLMALGFMKTWTWNHLLIRNLLAECREEAWAMGSAQRPHRDDGTAAGVCKGVASARVFVIPGLQFNPNCKMAKPGSEEGMRFRAGKGSTLEKFSTALLPRTRPSRVFSPQTRQISRGACACEVRAGQCLQNSVMCVTKEQVNRGNCFPRPQRPISSSPGKCSEPAPNPTGQGGLLGVSPMA